ATGTPTFSPSQLVASAVARAEAELTKRFCPMRIVASSFGVCALRLRIWVARRSRDSRSRARSIRPSETRAVSAPAKKAERVSDRTSKMKKTVFWTAMARVLSFQRESIGSGRGKAGGSGRLLSRGDAANGQEGEGLVQRASRYARPSRRTRAPRA